MKHYSLTSAVFLIATLARADLPSPRLDRIAPLGGGVGTATEIEIQGPELDDVKSLLIDHPGIKATLVKERRFKIEIAADVPEGTYDVRAVGKYGVSNPRLFGVTHGLKDVQEKEPNDEAATAQKVAINDAIHGHSDGNRDDVYRFTAKKGQRVVLSCEAGRLDSPMDATMVLSNADGKPLGSSSDYFGRDPFLDFVAPADGDYFVLVHDLTYRGGSPYRLIITDRPQVENVFPRAVQAGKPATLKRFGRNLSPAAKPGAWSIFDLPLDEENLTVNIPGDVLNLGAYRFSHHPADHSVLPTAATCTLTGFQVQGQPVVVTDAPVVEEQEGNDKPEQAQKISLPAYVSGRFDKPRDADWYEFEVKDAASYTFDVLCERIAGRADPYLVLTDAKGNRVAELDDFGHRINAFDGHLRDPHGQQSLSAKTTYRVLVQDRYQRGGARYQYVLAIRKAEPDFHAAVIHSQNPGPAGLNIWRGGAAHLDMILHTQGGFNAPITITAEGLPPGVHLPTTIVRNANHAALVLQADESAAEWAGTIKLFATAKVGEKEIRREVRPYTRVWQEANIGSSRPTRALALAVRESAPYALRFEPARLEVEAGKKTEVKVKVTRRWADFKAKVNLQTFALPGGVQMTTVEIPEGKDEATVSVTASAPPGEVTVTLLGQAQVPFSKDAKAANKPNTLVTLPATPLVVVVTLPKK